MTDRMTEIREYAQVLAEQCIEDWAHEDRHENNDVWDTDFTEDEMDTVVSLALRAAVVLPKE